MTGTLAPSEPRTRRSGRGSAPEGRPWTARLRPRRPSAAVLWPVLIMAGAAAVRLALVRQGYDVVQDEVDYVDLAMSAARGAFPPTFAGAPFLLHPPLFFFMTAAWHLALGPTQDYFALVTQTRDLNVALAVASTGLVYWLGSISGGRACGVAAAVLFAIDPYVLRQNDKAMLETSTLFWALAGSIVISRLLAGRVQRRWGAAVAGGLLLGLSIVANDIAVVLVLPPLALAAFGDWGRQRGPVLAALGASLVPYGIYAAALAGVGQITNFAAQQQLGVERMLGLVRTTGFNRPGGPSLLARMLQEASAFGVTYFLCGLGVLAGLYLLARHPRPQARYLGLVTVSATATIAYALAHGTIEAHFLYYLYVPALAAIPVAFLQWAPTAGRVPWRRLGVAALVLFVAYDTTVAVHTALTPDNGEQRLAAWLDAGPGRPASGPRPLVADDTDVTTLLLAHAGIRATDLTTARQAALSGVRYVTFLSAEEKGGYSNYPPAELAFLRRHGRLVWSFHEPTYGWITLWRTTDPAAW